MEEPQMEKNKSRAARMLKSSGARLRRRIRKSIIEKRTLNLFSKLRRLRKKK
jgi:hypothetical protein